MKIEFDYEFDSLGNIVARHFIETSIEPGNTALQTGVSAVPIDVIQCIKNIHSGLVPIAGTGWDVITKHPRYPGQTRLQALLGEMVRLNDTAGRAVLGV